MAAPASVDDRHDLGSEFGGVVVDLERVPNAGDDLGGAHLGHQRDVHLGVDHRDQARLDVVMDDRFDDVREAAKGHAVTLAGQDDLSEVAVSTRLVDEGGDPATESGHVVASFEHGDDLGRERVDRIGEEVFLVLVVLVEAGPGDVGTLGDVVAGDGVKALVEGEFDDGALKGCFGASNAPVFRGNPPHNRQFVRYQMTCQEVRHSGWSSGTSRPASHLLFDVTDVLCQHYTLDMPKVVDHEERRAAIASAAADLIAEVGLEAATMKGIAERADVTTGAVTHYFDSKDDVIFAALLLVDRSMQLRLEAGLEVDRPLVDVVLSDLPNDAESLRNWRVWRVFSDAATRSERLREYHRSSSIAWVEAVSAMLADHFGCTPQRARLDAELLLAVVDGIGSDASVDPDSWPIERQRGLIEHCLAKLGREAS